MRHLKTISEEKGYSKMRFLKHAVHDVIIPQFIVQLLNRREKRGRTSRFGPFFKYGKAMDKITRHFRNMASLGEMCKELFHMSKKQRTPGKQRYFRNLSTALRSQLHFMPYCGQNSVISWWKNLHLLLIQIFSRPVQCLQLAM